MDPTEKIFYFTCGASKVVQLRREKTDVSNLAAVVLQSAWRTRAAAKLGRRHQPEPSRNENVVLQRYGYSTTTPGRRMMMEGDEGENAASSNDFFAMTNNSERHQKQCQAAHRLQSWWRVHVQSQGQRRGATNIHDSPLSLSQDRLYPGVTSRANNGTLQKDGSAKVPCSPTSITTMPERGILQARPRSPSFSHPQLSARRTTMTYCSPKERKTAIKKCRAAASASHAMSTLWLRDSEVVALLETLHLPLNPDCGIDLRERASAATVCLPLFCTTLVDGAGAGGGGADTAMGGEKKVVEGGHKESVSTDCFLSPVGMGIDEVDAVSLAREACHRDLASSLSAVATRLSLLPEEALPIGVECAKVALDNLERLIRGPHRGVRVRRVLMLAHDQREERVIEWDADQVHKFLVAAGIPTDAKASELAPKSGLALLHETLAALTSNAIAGNTACDGVHHEKIAPVASLRSDLSPGLLGCGTKPSVLRKRLLFHCVTVSWVAVWQETGSLPAANGRVASNTGASQTLDVALRHLLLREEQRGRGKDRETFSQSRDEQPAVASRENADSTAQTHRSSSGNCGGDGNIGVNGSRRDQRQPPLEKRRNKRRPIGAHIDLHSPVDIRATKKNTTVPATTNIVRRPGHISTGDSSAKSSANLQGTGGGSHSRITPSPAAVLPRNSPKRRGSTTAWSEGLPQRKSVTNHVLVRPQMAISTSSTAANSHRLSQTSSPLKHSFRNDSASGAQTSSAAKDADEAITRRSATTMMERDVTCPEAALSPAAANRRARLPPFVTSHEGAWLAAEGKPMSAGSEAVVRRPLYRDDAETHINSALATPPLPFHTGFANSSTINNTDNQSGYAGLSIADSLTWTQRRRPNNHSPIRSTTNTTAVPVNTKGSAAHPHGGANPLRPATLYFGDAPPLPPGKDDRGSVAIGLARRYAEPTPFPPPWRPAGASSNHSAPPTAAAVVAGVEEERLQTRETGRRRASTKGSERNRGSRRSNGPRNSENNFEGRAAAGRKVRPRHRPHNLRSAIQQPMPRGIPDQEWQEYCSREGSAWSRIRKREKAWGTGGSRESRRGDGGEGEVLNDGVNDENERVWYQWEGRRSEQWWGRTREYTPTMQDSATKSRDYSGDSAVSSRGIEAVTSTGGEKRHDRTIASMNVSKPIPIDSGDHVNAGTFLWDGARPKRTEENEEDNAATRSPKRDPNMSDNIRSRWVLDRLLSKKGPRQGSTTPNIQQPQRQVVERLWSKLQSTTPTHENHRLPTEATMTTVAAVTAAAEHAHATAGAADIEILSRENAHHRGPGREERRIAAAAAAEKRAAASASAGQNAPTSASNPWGASRRVGATLPTDRENVTHGRTATKDDATLSLSTVPMATPIVRGDARRRATGTIYNADDTKEKVEIEEEENANSTHGHRSYSDIAHQQRQPRTDSGLFGREETGTGLVTEEESEGEGEGERGGQETGLSPAIRVEEERGTSNNDAVETSNEGRSKLSPIPSVSRRDDAKAWMEKVKAGLCW